MVNLHISLDIHISSAGLRCVVLGYVVLRGVIAMIKFLSSIENINVLFPSTPEEI